jgi:eukaryotic-like serine/threonine-protein kinase
MNSDASWGEEPPESRDEAAFADAVAAIGERIRTDAAIDLDAVTSMHPEWAERIKTIIPAIEALARQKSDSEPMLVVGGEPNRSVGETTGSLGDFQPIREIGRGGMGIVYEALQVSLNRHVALKILPHAWSYDPRMLKRFQVEAQAAGRLRHSHIVPVYLVGFENGVHFYAMQLIKGLTLAEVISMHRDAAHGLPTDPLRTPGGGIPPRKVAELGLQVAEALDFAHREGVVHRDIKPANLLVEESGWLWIADFGLARLQGGQDTTTGDSVKGTLRYMSPEQALGEQTQIDHRTDIYSLGATLYELIALRPAFDGDDCLELLRRIVREDPRPPRRIDPAIPVDLETIVMKAMAKVPAERYATAEELADDFRRFLDDRSIFARPNGVVRRSTRRALRNKSTVAAAVVVTLAAVVGILGIARWRADVLRHQNSALESAQTVVERSQRTTRRLWQGSQIQLAQQELAAGHVELAQEILERLRPGPDERDSLGFEWHYLRRLAHRDVSLLVGHVSAVQALTVSADGSMLVSGDAKGTLIFWDLVEMRERARASGHRRGVRLLAVSPDHRVLASVSDIYERCNEVKLWEPSRAREAVTLSGLSELVDRIAFSHDGRTLALWEDGSARRVSLWDVSRGPWNPKLVVPPIVCASAAPSPDRKLLATANRSGPVTIRDLSTGRTIRTLSPQFLSITGIGFSPHGRSVFVSDNELVSILNAETGELEGALGRTPGDGARLSLDVSSFLGPPVRVGRETFLVSSGSSHHQTILDGLMPLDYRFAFSPDGQTLAACGELLQASLWETATGKMRFAFPGKVRTLAFTPRGESAILGCQDDKVRIWHFKPRTVPLDRLAGHEAEVWSLAYTPDGTIVASAADDHTIMLWDTRSGQLQATLTGNEALVASLAISPDGKTIASASFDRTVRLWDLPSGRPRSVLRGHTDRVRAVSFSSDGKLLATGGSDFTVRLWNPEKACEIRTLQGHTEAVLALAFEPGSSRLVSTGNDRVLRVWDSIVGREIRSFPCPRVNTAVAFSRDGSLFVSGDDWGTVTVRDVDTWSERTRIKGSNDPIWGLAFSPDGQTLAAGCGDGRVRTWEPLSGQLSLVLDGHSQRVNAVTFAPDGRTLASASHAGEVKLWHTDPP